MAAAASTSMAAAVVLMHRLPEGRNCAVSCPLLQRPSLSSAPFKLLKITDSSRLSSQLLVKASTSDETDSPIDANELFTDLKEKWDAIEDKTSILLYGGGGIVAVWLASIVVTAINSVPLLPNIMELVGLGYTGWFVYRYLLFKSSREELASDIEAIKKKIDGTE